MSEKSVLVPAPLPVRLSSFGGRRAEIAELRRLVAETRLVTLVGAGGCGKTRLALEVAARVGSSFADGVAFVDLAPIHDPGLVPESVAAELGLSRAAADRLSAVIGDARLLLVVDNAEHLAEAVSTLVERLLAACPCLVVLATSREPLHVDGERSWRVPPMLLPPDAEAADPAALAGYDAVWLFCARAGEQSDGFELTEGNAALVAAICRRLDGMPLALELVAARVRSFALTEILRRLEDTLGLLTHGPRGAEDRHRTLRATLEWSHRLLHERERLLFRRLALFVGTFELEAVEAICTGRDLTAGEVADVLERLVDRSLVCARRGARGGMCYSLMEAVRQFAQEQLDEAGETALEARHARWYGDLASRLADSRRLLAERLERMTVEYDNIRRALDWAAAEDPELEARMIVRLRWFWRARGSVGEARQLSAAAAARCRVPAALQAALHVETANWLTLSGELSSAHAQAEAAALVLDELDDPELAARVLSTRGLARSYTSPDAAERDLERARALLTPSADPELRARVLNKLTLLRLVAGRVPEALTVVGPLRSVIAELRDRSVIVPALLHTYGEVLLAAGRPAEARDVFLEGLDEAARYRNYPVSASQLQGLACAAWDLGDAVLCLELAAAARRCARSAGVREFEEPGLPFLAAERGSEAALSPRAAARAREVGWGLHPHAALVHARRVPVVETPAPAALTARKREIVDLVAEGLTSKEIARRLAISERTVDAHLDQVRRQLGLSNRAQVAAWAGTHQQGGRRPY